MLEGIEHGLGIPDDIMMRANMHTCLPVRQALRAHLPQDSTQSLREALASGPTWFNAALSTLLDSDRPLRIGATEIQAAQLLGDMVDTFSDGMDTKAHRHEFFVTQLPSPGWDTYAAMVVNYSGNAMGIEWFPSPMWPEAIERYRLISSGMPENYFDTFTRTPWRLEYEDARRFIRDKPGKALCDIRRERSDPTAERVSSSNLLILLGVGL